MPARQSALEGTNDSRPAFVVGIGASAGGLEALEQLFDHVRPDSGMAFVVVQHLSPDFASVMDELLVRHTDLPVKTVQDGMPVERDTIYLIPPRKQMEISAGRLLLSDKDPSQGLSLPIDVFLGSLAEQIGPRAIAIILSGTGSDGSRGIRAISAAGGLVIAQREETAKFDGMPKSALKTGVVDVSLSPAEIGPALAQYAQNPVPRELAASRVSDPLDETAMARLLRLLHDAYGIDFSHYKRSTVNRRIERRLLLNHNSDLESYVSQLASDPDELNSLYRDLLIGVTQFFRDREAFEALDQSILPEFLNRLSAEDEIRVWVAGCATGEEAYSLAILLHEHLTRRKRPINVKIFATDVHQTSLDIAGAGCYAREQLEGVSAERMAQYFSKQGNHYQVCADLRQMIVFAKHNILKDAPFTRIHLVSCRNLLIYFEPEAQQRALSLFHFGLRADGILFLGPSEGLSGLDDEFATVERQWKIFRKLRDSRLLPAPDVRLSAAESLQPQAGLRRPPHAANGSGSPARLGPIYDLLLDSCIPAGLLLDDRHKLLHIFGDAGKYLHHDSGRVTDDAVALIPRSLRTALKAALQRAASQKSPVSYAAIAGLVEGHPQNVLLGVRPFSLNGSSPSHFLVTLDESPDAQTSTESEELNIEEVSRERIASLETDLRSTKENLQATIEELEASNEELHATNEELVASNEELQSTNEELHSVNEELFTVNAEYQRKISELSELTDDMDNLLASTDVGVVFLDRELCLRRFTPRAAQVFNIVDKDIGRQFATFSGNLLCADLCEDAGKVLRTGKPIEEEVTDRAGNWYLLRVLPYSSKSDVQGVVVTLIDIASLKKAEEELRDQKRKLQGILDHAPAFIYVKDLEGRYVLANRRARRVLNADSMDLAGKTDYDILPRHVADQIEAHDRHVAVSGEILKAEETIPRKGRPRTYLSVKYPLRDESGRMFAIAGIITDITRRKVAQRKAKQAIKQRDRFLAMLSHELRNPLAAVRNGVELLSRFKFEDPVATGATKAILCQTDQMTRLMDDLLDISRVTHGKIEIVKQPLDLTEIAVRSAEVVRSMMAEQGHEFVIDLPNHPVFVTGDAARLQQIFVNLLINAAKYTREAGTVSFTLSRVDPMAVARVKDTGVGMTAAMRRRVFEPFFQSDETLDRSDGGMGVGLTLVQTLVDLHGGDVRVESPGRGKGSEFFVRLPLTEPPAEQAKEDAIDVSAPVGDLTVLLVEDNDQLRYTTQTLLQLEGYTVVSAADGLSALTACEAHQPGVALVDIGLPALDGYGVARRIREKAAHDSMYLVALTGYGQETDRKRALDAGFDEHLTKPVDVNSLLEMLKRIAVRQIRGTS